MSSTTTPTRPTPGARTGSTTPTVGAWPGLAAQIEERATYGRSWDSSIRDPDEERERRVELGMMAFGRGWI
jgi:hypothetical protein